MTRHTQNLTFPRTLREAFGHEGDAIQKFVAATSGDNGDRLVFWGVLAMTAALVVFALVRGVMAGGMV